MIAPGPRPDHAERVGPLRNERRQMTAAELKRKLRNFPNANLQLRVG